MSYLSGRPDDALRIVLHNQALYDAEELAAALFEVRRRHLQGPEITPDLLAAVEARVAEGGFAVPPPQNPHLSQGEIVPSDLRPDAPNPLDVRGHGGNAAHAPQGNPSRRGSEGEWFVYGDGRRGPVPVLFSPLAVGLFAFFFSVLAGAGLLIANTFRLRMAGLGGVLGAALALAAAVAYLTLGSFLFQSPQINLFALLAYNIVGALLMAGPLWQQAAGGNALRRLNAAEAADAHPMQGAAHPLHGTAHTAPQPNAARGGQPAPHPHAMEGTLRPTVQPSALPALPYRPRAVFGALAVCLALAVALMYWGVQTGQMAWSPQPTQNGALTQ